MNRRQLVRGAAVVLIATSVAGCVANDLHDDDFVFRSTFVNGHDHLLFVDDAFFERIPAQQVVIETDDRLGHDHAVLFEPEDFERIAMGERIEKTTSVDAGGTRPHVHRLAVALFLGEARQADLNETAGESDTFTDAEPR